MLTFTTVGNGAKSWQLTDEQIASWQALYPSLDVDQQCRMALAWTEANHKKTAKGMPRYLVGWLNKAVARGDVRRISRPQAGVLPTYYAWECPHHDRHWNRGDCQIATTLGKPLKAEAS